LIAFHSLLFTSLGREWRPPVPEVVQAFDVELPADAVWALFQDVPNVARCVPRAQLTDVLGGDTYRGRLRVKLGALAVEFEGEARVAALDEAARSATIEADGSDRHGSRAAAQVTYTLTDQGPRTRVEVVATYRLQGTVAQFGRGAIIEEVAGRLTREFVECLHRRFEEHRKIS
jgi:carbon monoxide dehydrogenase subunit G